MTIRFDPARAARLDDPARFAYLPVASVVALVDAPRDAVVLDLGAGTGTYAIALAQARPDCTVLAYDVQAEMLAFLRAKPESELVRSGGPELLAAYRGRIDRVISINVIHELDDDDFRLVFGALAPGAQVTFVDWNADVDGRPGGPPRERCYDPAGARERLAAFGVTGMRSELFRYQYAVTGLVGDP